MTEDHTNPTSADRGWWFPAMYRRGKAHWAVSDGRSLCGKWAAFAVPDEGFENDGGARVSSDECAACRRKLDVRRGHQAPTEHQGVQR